MAKSKHAGGRPTKYKKKYALELISFFSAPPHDKFLKKEVITKTKDGKEKIQREYMPMPAPLPTLLKFARHIEVDYTTVYRWANDTDKKGKPKNEEFCKAYNEAKKLQEEFLVANGLAGFSPPASFIFVAKNITSLKDKQEIDHTSGGKPITVGVVSYADAAKAIAEKKKQSQKPTLPANTA